MWEVWKKYEKVDNIQVENQKKKKEDSKTSEAFEETVIGIIWDATIDGIPGGLNLAEEPEEPPAHEVESAGPSHITDFQSPCLG